MKHTKELNYEWFAEKELVVIYKENDTQIIAKALSPELAKLIAAAPTMLNVLQTLERLHERGMTETERKHAFQRVTDAIKKATE